jgi:tetratricopeptide (TPR) repeat protein
LAGNLVRTGSLQILLENHPVALEALLEARGIYDELVKIESQNSVLLAEQGKCLINLGISQGKLADGEHAQETLDEAIDLFEGLTRDHPEREDFKRNLGLGYSSLAQVLKQIGRIADAVDAMLKRKPLWPNDPLQLYQLARDLILLSPPSSKELSDAEKAARMKHLELVIGVLTDARRAGYADWKAAEEDEAFAPLKDLESFRKLLADE